MSTLGTSSVLSGLEYDSAPPRNIDDIALHAELQELPEDQPLDQFTNSSYSHVSSQTVDFRVRLCGIVNQIKASTSFQDACKYSETIQLALDGLPKWTSTNSLQARALLDLQLRQFMIILHTPRALNVESASQSEARFSKITVLEASTAVIDVHTELLASANLALCCTRSDYFRGVMLTAHIAYHASKTHGATRF